MLVPSQRVWHLRQVHLRWMSVPLELMNVPTERFVSTRWGPMITRNKNGNKNGKRSASKSLAEAQHGSANKVDTGILLVTLLPVCVTALMATAYYKIRATGAENGDTMRASELVVIMRGKRAIWTRVHCLTWIRLFLPSERRR